MKFHEGVLGLLLATFTYVAGSSPAGSGGYYGGAGGYGHPQQQQQHAQQYPGYYQQQQFHQQQQQQYQQPNYQPQQANQVEDQQAATQEEVAGPEEEVKDGEKGDTGALPEPWQEHIDPSSGRPYYYNPETSVTQWERPEAPAQPVPSPEARPEQHHQRQQADTIKSAISPARATSLLLLAQAPMTTNHLIQAALRPVHQEMRSRRHLK